MRLAVAAALTLAPTASAAVVLHPGHSRLVGRTRVVCTASRLASARHRVVLHPGHSRLVAGRRYRCVRVVVVTKVGALPGDPRVCGAPSGCVKVAAEDAALARLRVLRPGWVGSLVCTQTAAYSYSCAWQNSEASGAEAVVFAQGRTRWTTTVTP